MDAILAQAMVASILFLQRSNWPIGIIGGELKAQNAKHEDDLKALQKSVGDNDALKQTIEDLQKQNDEAKSTYEAQI